MLSIRQIWELPAFVLIGVLVTLAFYFFSKHSGFFPAAILLPFVVAVVGLPMALRDLARHFMTLRRSLAWWHGLWLLVFFSTLVFRTREAKAIREAALDFWAVYRIILMGITVFVLLARLAFRQTRWISSLFRGLAGAMTIYAFVSLTSGLWSVYPAWTFYKSFEYLADVALLAAILATARSVEAYKTLMDWTWTLYALLLASVWLGAFIWPKEALQSSPGLIGFELHGVLPSVHANSVGEFAAILAIVALNRLLERNGVRPRWTSYGLLLAGSLLTLVLSQTRSALAGFLFGTVLLLFFSRRFGLIALLVSTLTLALTLTRFSDLSWTFIQRGQNPEAFASLSGRMGWWEFGWEKFLEKPLTGLGAYAGPRFAVLAELGETSTASIHNTYVEVIVGTGIWGLLPVLIALLGTWWFLLRQLQDPFSGAGKRQLSLEAVGVLAVITVRSLFTTHLIWHSSALLFLAVLGYAEFLRRQQRSSRRAVG